MHLDLAPNSFVYNQQRKLINHDMLENQRLIFLNDDETSVSRYQHIDFPISEK